LNQQEELKTLNEELKVKLEQAHRVLYMEGLAEDTTRGHITVRSADQRIYLKPWGMGFEEVTVEDFIGVDPEGNLVEGEGRLHSELILHLEIYRRRNDVFSITHLHPYHCVILSSVFKGRMKRISQHGLHFLKGVPFYESAGLIHSKEQAQHLAETLGDQSAVLMRNHGFVTAGRTIEEAVIVAIDFEKAAKEHLMTSSFGEPTEIPTDVATKMAARIYSPEQFDMLWGYYCRKLLREK
jgi:L-fuculose-phosphate aldolase